MHGRPRLIPETIPDKRFSSHGNKGHDGEQVPDDPEDIKTSILKMNFLGVISRGMGLEITLACMKEVDSGRMDMRQFLLNYNLMRKALGKYKGEEQMIYGSEDVNRWIKAHEEEIHAAHNALWPVWPAIPETNQS